MRMPLARDFYSGARMNYGGKTVIYVGQAGLGSNFVFERPLADRKDHLTPEFLALSPFELLTKAEPFYPPFDEAKWRREKDEAEYAAWVDSVNAKISKINTAIRKVK